MLASRFHLPAMPSARRPPVTAKAVLWFLKTRLPNSARRMREEPAMYEEQFKTDGFEWIDLSHPDESVICFRRKGKEPEDDLLVLLNLTPVPRWNWPVTVQGKAFTQEIFNSDSKKFWGTGDVHNPEIKAEKVKGSSNVYKMIVHLPPLAGIILK